jgi:hypothetical protein
MVVLGFRAMAFQAVCLDDLAQRPVTALDVVRLRDALAYEDYVTETEAQSLFAIEFARFAKHPSWKGFFIDAIAEHAIHDTAPYGYLTALKADWLLRQVAPEGRILSANAFELVTTLMGLARWVPERLVSALLDEVYCAVAISDGPLRDHTLPPGTITELDSEIVRQILYTAGSCGQGGITRVEAEGLLAIDAIIVSSSPVAGWTELLAKAIGDAILTASGQAGPIREMFLASECATTDAPTVSSSLRRNFARYRNETNEHRAIASLERQRVSIITGDLVRPATTDWLIEALAGQQCRASVALTLLFDALTDHRHLLDVAFQPLINTARVVRAA